MTDVNYNSQESELDLCDREIFQFARRLAIAGGVSLIVGATGLIATSGQTTWDVSRSLYLLLVAAGPIGILIGHRLVRTLMKHRHKELRIF
ncbi:MULTISPECIES: hypothetical protein [Rhodobacterales]|uniref:hypothetical protein n=1 Tax=Rhodobacterales TaxID=204455 RepID=UPI001111FC27|nr:MULTISPECIES: hypothetical protein [Rhodobacterales]WGI23095.1 hypothetical protein QBD29_06655 [Amylibacter sp. IMCC11727]